MTERGILGIKNRTENWKTAVYFSQHFDGKGLPLAQHLGGEPELNPGEVKLELFWRGMRDYLHKIKGKKEDMEPEIGKHYQAIFSKLRADVVNFGEFRTLRNNNYNTSTSGWMTSLFDNVRNTEVDVVLETPDTLYIGEAKHEMTFGANGDLFLVHQLIRQYVMATVLVGLSHTSQVRKVVPFVVGDDVAHLNRSTQVKFMISQGWLRGENVLAWEEIESLNEVHVSCSTG